MLATHSDTSDLASLDLDELESEPATLAAHLHAGTRRSLELVAELDRRGGFAACLSIGSNAGESLELHGRLAPEDGALLLRALEAQRDRAWDRRNRVGGRRC